MKIDGIVSRHQRRGRGKIGVTMQQDIKAGVRLSTWRYRYIFLLFTFACFYFLTVDVLADDVVMGAMGADRVLPVHCIYLVFQAIGFLAFSLVQRFTRTTAARRAVLVGIYVLSLLSLFGFTFGLDPAFLLPCVMINLLLSGTIGASVYFYASMILRDEPCMGRFCGLSIAAAALLQIVLSVADLGKVANGIVLAAALVVAGYLTLTRTPQALPSFDRNFSPAEPPLQKRRLIIMLVVVALISMMGGINDGTLTLMQAQNALSLYSFPRLFYLVGVIAAGFIADYRQGRFLPMSVLTIMLCATIGVLFLDNTVLLNLNACVYSLLAGFAVIFFTVPFFKIAAASSRPALWASMGRVLRLIFMLAGTLLMTFCLQALSFSFTIGVFIILSVCLVVLFWAGGFLLSPYEDGPADGRSVAVDSDKLHLLAQTYDLTQREGDVLEKLLTTEDGVQEIADSLLISRRVLQRHISSIYKKTGMKSRIGLFQLCSSLQSAEKKKSAHADDANRKL